MSDSYLVVELAGELLALPGTKVAAILEPAPVTPVPFVPNFVDGLIGAGGTILPQIDLYARLHGRDAAQARTAPDGELVHLSGRAGPYVIKVDRVRLLVSADQVGELHEPDLTRLAEGAVPTRSFTWRGETVLLLDPDGLGLEDVEAIGLPETKNGSLLGTISDDVGVIEELLPPVVVVTAQQERYAFPVEFVQEVFVTGEITPLPKAPHEVAGLTILRNEPMLVLHFGRLLGQPGDGALKYVAVVRRGDLRFGLLVDRVLGIRRFREKQQHATLDGRRGLDGYFVTDDDAVVGAVDPNQLIDDTRLEEFATFAPKSRDGDNAVAPVAVRPFLIFLVGKELCGLDLQHIERVVEWRPPEVLPEAGSGIIHSAIDIHGQVMPVTDLRRHLGLDMSQDPGAYIVVRMEGSNWALAVDQIRRIISVPINAIESVRGESQKMITEIARLDQQLVWVFSLGWLNDV